MKPSEVLRQAKDLLEDPTHWCREAYARDAEGSTANPCDPKATQWCARGAVRHVLGDIPEDLFCIRGSIDYLYRAAPADGVVGFNDNPKTTHEDILNLLDRAASLAEQEGN